MRKDDGSYMYVEVQTEYGGHNPTVDDLEQQRSPFVQPGYEELQAKKIRDAKLKNRIRRFRFLVRLADLGCRYLLLWVESDRSVVVIGILASNLSRKRCRLYYR